MIGFECLKDLYTSDIDLGEIYSMCENHDYFKRVPNIDEESLVKEEHAERKRKLPHLREERKYSKVGNFLLREGRLCLYHSSWRKLLVREAHSGG